MFIGRKKELEALNAFYEGDKEALACVSGALGMGKTTLLRHFADGKKAIYFHAYETTGKQELSMFTQVLAKADIAGVAAGEDTGKRSEASLENLLDAITEIAKQEKLLLVIDQYPNFVKADADFDEILFSYVTRVWRDLPIKLILCGDAFLLMEKYLYGKKARYDRSASASDRDGFSGDKAIFPGGSRGRSGTLLWNQRWYPGADSAYAGKVRKGCG